MGHIFFLVWALLGFVFGAVAQPIQNHIVGISPIKGNEPAIAFSPINPLKGVLAFNVNQVFTTDDGGKTWSLTVVDPPQGFYGDPVLKYGKNGTVYLAHLAKNKSLPWPQHFDRIVFERSVDGGRTFSATDVGYHAGKMQDKPWFAVDEWGGSKFKGNIYLSYTEFDVYGSKLPTDSSRIYFSASTDDGVSFSSPVKVNDRCGTADDDDGTLEGANCAITPDGVIHMVWAGRDTIWYDKSEDGGKTWGKDKAIGLQRGGWNHGELPGQMRANGMPFIVASKKGELYVAYSALPDGELEKSASKNGNNGSAWGSVGTLSEHVPDINIYMLYSGNAGRDFEKYLIAGDYSPQYSPMLGIDPSSSEVWITWADRRRSTTGYFYDIYGCYVKGTKISKILRMSAVPSVAPGKMQFMGDYLGLSVGVKKVWVAYTAWSLPDKFPYIRLVELDRNSKGKQGYSKVEFAELVAYPTEIEKDAKKKNVRRLAIWAAWPDAKSLTVEIRQGKQMVFQHVFESVDFGYVDMTIPLERLGQGVFDVVTRSKGKEIKQQLYLHP